jgi:teichuronic acid biosynthesis glycosyltransferase TuaC
MKVLSVSSVFPNPYEPGCGTFVRSRLEHLSALAELRVVAPVAVVNYQGWKRGAGSQRLPRGAREKGLEVRYVRWMYPPGGGFLNALCLFLQLWWPVRQLRKKFAFDVIDAHFGHPEGVAASLLAAVLGCPFTVTLRGSEVLHAEPKLRRFWMSWALRRAARVITVSEKMRRFAIGLGADPSRVRTIPNGVDGRIFFPRDREACRKRYGLPAHGRVILSAGHLIELKGHHRVVQVIRGLVDAGHDVHLLIAGGVGRLGNYEEQISRQIGKLGLEERVQLLGEIRPEALAELMSAADLLCLASSREGWPNVVHEALSCGTPVVAADVGAVAEMIPSARFGLIVPPHDPAALEQALGHALATDWDREAIAVWGQSRSWDQVAREVLREMKEIVGDQAA